MRLVGDELNCELWLLNESNCDCRRCGLRVGPIYNLVDVTSCFQISESTEVYIQEEIAIIFRVNFKVTIMLWWLSFYLFLLYLMSGSWGFLGVQGDVILSWSALHYCRTMILNEIEKKKIALLYKAFIYDGLCDLFCPESNRELLKQFDSCNILHPSLSVCLPRRLVWREMISQADVIYGFTMQTPSCALGAAVSVSQFAQALGRVGITQH